MSALLRRGFPFTHLRCSEPRRSCSECTLVLTALCALCTCFHFHSDCLKTLTLKFSWNRRGTLNRRREKSASDPQTHRGRKLCLFKYGTRTWLISELPTTQTANTAIVRISRHHFCRRFQDPLTWCFLSHNRVPTPTLEPILKRVLLKVSLDKTRLPNVTFIGCD